MNSEFRFIRVDSFLDDMNREECFDTQDMDGISPNFRIILANTHKSNINECLDEDGTINTDVVSIIETENEEDGYCSLLWNKGVNGERSITISDSTVTYDLGEEQRSINALFLTNIVNGTGYVLAYCISDKSIVDSGSLILPTNGVIWSIRYGG